MSFELVMPRAGLTMVEGTIASWLAAEGQQVKKGEAIMEFENEKNTIEFNCTHEGILHITAPEGETVAVGAPIGIVAENQAEYDAICGAAAPAPAPAAVEQPAAPAPVSAPAAPAAVEDTTRVRATGLAKKMAKQHGVTLSAICGTGPNRRIIAQDVLDYLEAQKSAPAPAAAPAAPAADDVITEIQMTGIRKAIAKNMYGSLQEMAQCTAAVEVDVTELLAYRQKLVDNQEYLGCKVTVNDLLAMATVKMLQKHPTANATFDGKTLFVHSAVNLSVAVAAEVGLMVPVVKNAQRMSLVELHNAMSDVAVRARDQKLKGGEQAGGTFTISNVGMFPIDWSTPIINPPQVAILGFGRAVKKPAVVGEDVKIRSMMHVFLTFDHRVFDGLEVGRIMADLQKLLEHPELITV
jgi:pyruvate dehydrogenase complex dihydrolipoamide acetyltransferase long form